MSTATLQPFKITKPLVQKINGLIDHGLTHGKGKPEPGKMCIEAMICFALGLPHSDDPPCVSRALREVKITLNDADWSNDKARANGMRKLAIAQLGTAGVLDDVEFTKRLAEQTIRKMIPRCLRIVAPLIPSHTRHLEAAAVKCEMDGNYDAASAASDAANAASAASYAARAASDAANAASAASDAASAASDAARAASAASYAASAASDAARAASDAANAASAASYAASAKDAELTFFADLVLDVLITMKVPGVRWLKYAKPNTP